MNYGRAIFNTVIQETTLSSSEEIWGKMFLSLAEFRIKQGHCLGPETPQENIFLWKWINDQRNNKKSLNRDRIVRLNSINFPWTLNDLRWEKNFKELLEFKVIYNHCNVPPSHKNRSLARWVTKLRLRKNTLNANRIKRLNQIGFYWNPYDKPWDEKFLRLIAFKNKFGHCNVPQYFADDPSLASWVEHQRSGRDKLDSSKKKKLNNLGFEWTPKRNSWEKKYNELVEFKKKYGQCYKNFQDNNLSEWVIRQRRLESNLKPDQRKRLDDIGFVWDVRESLWDKNFIKLKRFKKKNGHCNVPSKYSNDLSLGRWVSRQRKERSKLSPERLAKLENLGFVWSLQK